MQPTKEGMLEQVALNYGVEAAHLLGSRVVMHSVVHAFRPGVDYPHRTHWFARVHAPLLVWKGVRFGVCTPAIVELELGYGVIIHIGPSRKMRASIATVRRINKLVWPSGIIATGRKADNVCLGPEVKHANSVYDSNFIYTQGKQVRPLPAFSHVPHECGGGIHFYLDQLSAARYAICAA